MKDNSFAAGCGVAVLVLIALCAFGLLFSPGLAGEQAKENMATYTPAAPTQAAGNPLQGYVSESGLAEMLRDLESHDEAMADQVVKVAQSGDAAQTITAVSGDWAGAVLPCLGGLGMIVFLVLFATRKGESG